MRRSAAGHDNPTAVKPAGDAPAQPPSPETAARRLRRLDWLLVGVVLLFAFLTALFPVYHSDFFLHAAAGRLLAHGQYSFGADPFAFTTAGVAWINHSWLYDLLIYLVYQSSAAGGTILIVLKALMIAALAEMMLRTARPPGRGLWVPAACVGLAVLAISPRLLLEPVCVSYFFLGLTCWLLGLPRWMRNPHPNPPPPVGGGQGGGRACPAPAFPGVLADPAALPALGQPGRLVPARADDGRAQPVGRRAARLAGPDARGAGRPGPRRAPRPAAGADRRRRRVPGQSLLLPGVYSAVRTGTFRGGRRPWPGRPVCVAVPFAPRPPILLAQRRPERRRAGLLSAGPAGRGVVRGRAMGRPPELAAPGRMGGVPGAERLARPRHALFRRRGRPRRRAQLPRLRRPSRRGGRRAGGDVGVRRSHSDAIGRRRAGRADLAGLAGGAAGVSSRRLDRGAESRPEGDGGADRGLAEGRPGRAGRPLVQHVAGGVPLPRVVLSRRARFHRPTAVPLRRGRPGLLGGAQRPVRAGRRRLVGPRLAQGLSPPPRPLLDLVRDR